MSELRELYQEVILDHNRQPRNFGPLDGSNCEAHGDNPLCGDTIDVFLQVEEGVVQRAGFEGSGCAISTASASLMTEALTGLSVTGANALMEGFLSLVKGESSSSGESLGKLAVFEGVREFPMRVKCATLCWHTARAAWSEDSVPVTTE
ncbi:MAG: SUF system NifU family Fe-S cluster assembly protein [Myxococcota bacterium]|nr:SUF system NifU family Fe-S cluster assembly protein [Myxococcota bacterium]